jgi:hypothetical protein
VVELQLTRRSGRSETRALARACSHRARSRDGSSGGTCSPQPWRERVGLEHVLATARPARGCSPQPWRERFTYGTFSPGLAQRIRLPAPPWHAPPAACRRCPAFDDAVPHHRRPQRQRPLADRTGPFLPRAPARTASLADRIGWTRFVAALCPAKADRRMGGARGARLQRSARSASTQDPATKDPRPQNARWAARRAAHR